MNRLRTAGALLACVLLAGCAAPRGTEPPVRPLNVRDMNTFTLPLDAYTPGPAQQDTLLAAEKKLVARCLERRGLDADVPDPHPAPPGRNARRYGIVDEARARTLGYSVPEISKRPPHPRMPEEVRRAVRGDGGCDDEAARTLDAGIPDLKAERRMLGRASFGSYDLARRDRRVRAVFAKWSACMKKSGHRYATPPDAVRDKRFLDGAGHRVGPAEIGTAVADARCKRETGVVNVWASVETAYQERAIARNRAAFDALRGALTRRLANAANVLNR
ncbi:hypothetical protein ACQP1W_46765 [Spirillospora sp. CA-255316]